MTPFVQDMCVNNSLANVFVALEFLDRADVVIHLQGVRSKGVLPHAIFTMRLMLFAIEEYSS